MSTIRKNMIWNDEKCPILLSPAGMDYLWGGERLREEYGKRLSQHPLAETWECSTHADGLSLVASGPWAGRTLQEALEANPGWIGTHPREVMESRGDASVGGGLLPVLIKFIDAAQDLSVQVHPDDDYALRHEGQPGKTEMWYVLDARPGAGLIYGFSHDMDETRLLEALRRGRLPEHFQWVPVQRGDVFLIRPGTVHAIGGGVLLAEIQESSNVTYRLWDYGRVDKDGKPRKLHVEKALRVIRYTEEPAVRQQLRVLRYQPGSACEVLCRCRYFLTERVLVSSEYVCRVENNSFQVFLVLEGSLDIEGLAAEKGDCVFLPAGCGIIRVGGKGQFLKISC